MKQKPSITIGIPTCYGGDSIIKTVLSIKKSCREIDHQIHIVADTRPLTKEIMENLNKLGVNVTFNEVPSGQFAKDKQIIKGCNTELLIITQDDVIFADDLVTKILKRFEKDEEITMIVAKVKPEKAQGFFEKAITVGVSLVNDIAKNWNNGDNYLASNGRCMAFKTKFIKKLHIPDNLVSGDAYLYFENNKKGGKFEYLFESFVMNKSPQNLKEHMKQSGRFQNTYKEMNQYFRVSQNEFNPPKGVVAKSILMTLNSHSLYCIAYIAILLYTRIIKESTKITAFWDVDISTKRV